MEFQSIIFKVNLRLRLKPLLVCSLLGLISPVKAADFNVQYDSRYVTEGRNNLQRGGIVWLSLDNEIIEHVSVNLVYGYATSSNVNYDELNLIFEYANTVGKVDWYVNYTSLHFFKDELTDNEIGFGISYPLFESFERFTDILYSVEAAGFFAETGIRFNHTMNTQWLFSAYLLAGFDFGYISPTHDGHNHSAIGAEINFALNDQMTLSAIFETTRGGSDISREQGIKSNHNWVGVGLSTTF
jgi:hypothetical protein